jgi:hypothetical protein
LSRSTGRDSVSKDSDQVVSKGDDEEVVQKAKKKKIGGVSIFPGKKVRCDKVLGQ